ncbi:MAG TPA: FRG domain-containing protein, partial [Puia sp.]|nr:FRG domain-containing protein [Puia sp.]
KIFLHANPRQYQNDWAWLMQAQHYGIPTRLLDWTLKPEVALYFAVDNPNFDHVSAQFLVIYYPLFEIMIEGGFQEQFFETKPSALNNTWLLNPSFYAEADHDQAIGEVRRARQHGKFTIQSYDWSFVGLDAQANFLKSYDSTIKTYEPVIEKYIIPAQFKAQLRLDLIAREWYCEWLYKEEDDVINRIKGECKTILADYVSARIS